VPGSTYVEKLYFLYYQRRWEGWSYSDRLDRFVDVRGVPQTPFGGGDFRVGDRVRIRGPFDKDKNEIFKEVTMPPNPGPLGPKDPAFLLNPPFVLCEITEIIPINETRRYLFKYKSIEPGGAPKYYWFYHEQLEQLNRSSCGDDKLNDPFPRDNSTLKGYVYTYAEGAEPWFSPRHKDTNALLYATTYFRNDSGANLIEYNRGRWRCQVITTSATNQWANVSGSVCPGTINTNWIWNPTKNPEDASYYVYPADGSTDRPHMWSYFKTNPPGDLSGTWPATIQRNLYPSLKGGLYNDDSGTGDNHQLFVNFPDDKDTATLPIDRRRAAKGESSGIWI